MGITEDLLNDLGDATKTQAIQTASNGIDYIKGTTKRRSVKQMANGLICYYNMFTSTAISTETASILTKALEHEYINLLIIVLQDQIAFNATQRESTFRDILKKFHTNIKAESVDWSFLDEDGVQLVDYSLKTSNVEDNDFKTLNELNIIEVSNFPKTTLNERSMPFILDEDDKNSIGIGKCLDSKKVNALQPTIVELKLKFIVNNQSKPVDKVVKFGIKGVTCELLSSEIVYNFVKNIDDSNWLLKFVKYKKGELNLFKDILLHTSENKERAKNALKGKFSLWKRLTDLGRENKIKNLLEMNKTPLVATATMILDISEIERIKNASNVDLLSNIGAVKKIMNNFFLLGFVVVDQTSDVVYIYNDNLNEYEYYNFNAIRAFGKEEIDMNNMKSLLK